jgi:activator of 2-hydroxyglutaryl-CoA dehydratase
MMEQNPMETISIEPVVAGIDIGSTTSKAVLLRGGQILGRTVRPNSALPSQTAREVFAFCCQEAGITMADVAAVATTGYGRRLAGFGDMVITEIKACALGVNFLER